MLIRNRQKNVRNLKNKKGKLVVKRKKEVILNDDGSYTVKESKHKNIPAFIICLLLALVIWVYTANETKIDEKVADSNEGAVDEATYQDA